MLPSVLAEAEKSRCGNAHGFSCSVSPTFFPRFCSRRPGCGHAGPEPEQKGRASFAGEGSYLGGWRGSPPYLATSFYDFLFIDPWGFSACQTHRPLAGAWTAFQMSQELFRKWPSPTLGSKDSSGTLVTTEPQGGLPRGLASETRNVSTLCTICILKREISKANML